ncbi:MAG: hypothetical protein MJ252_04350, partial [archaeon]|nr:hypothetical protein [archaeon]
MEILNIGGNKRFIQLMKEYKIEDITTENREIKYHLIIAEYYRKLLTLEIKKDTNKEEFEKYLLKKPKLTEGEQLMKYIQKEIREESNHKTFKNDAIKIYNKLGSVAGSVGSSIKNKAYDKAIEMGMEEQINDAKNVWSQKDKYIKVHPIVKYTGKTAAFLAKGAGKIMSVTGEIVYNTPPVQFITKAIEGHYVRTKTALEGVIEGFSSWDGSKKFTFDEWSESNNKKENEEEDFLLEDNYDEEENYYRS